MLTDRLVLGKFKSPQGVMTIGVFTSMREFHETLAHYPLAQLELFTLGHNTNHVELHAVALALTRKGLGVYGEKLVSQMFQMAAYRMGEVASK